VLLYCYRYDPMTGRYGLAVVRILRMLGAALVVALGAFILVHLRRERRVRKALSVPEPRA
jgi:protein SCO1/2